MSIGIIIFVISVIVTIISAINDNSHKERQKQQRPTHGQPQTKNSQPQKRGFLEEVGKAFKEIEKQLNEEPTTTGPRPQPSKPSEPSSEKMETPQPTRPTTVSSNEQSETEAEKEKRTQNQKDEQLRKELEQTLMGDLQDVKSELDRENEKKLQRTERKARAIIADKNLSERTKRYRLKQLIYSHKMQSSNVNGQFRFDNDEVVNGIIWSKILEKPKQL